MVQYSRRWPTAVDLFCGCGGVTAGLKRRRFRVVAAVDCDPVACATYAKNHKTVHLIRDDIRTVDPRSIRRTQLKGADLDLLAVCAPCQPFSSQNQKSGTDERTALILEAIRFARALRPRLILFENVPGLARAKFAHVLDRLRTGLRDEGYVLSLPSPVDAADYGVPQRRLRCVLLARRAYAPPPLPAPSTPPGRRNTVAAAIEDLRPLTSGERSDVDPLHFARSHKPIALERLAHIPQDGGSRDALPAHLHLACHRGHTGHPDVYGRMAWEDVAPTLTTGCTDVTRGRFAHPRDNRAITLREAARLQTFPDSYIFTGNASQVATQIGNAVPVRLVETLAPTLRAALKNEL